MSISIEQVEEYKNDIAVVCCRTEKGTVIGPGSLEDPSIFPDLVDSGLLTIPENALKIGEVLGATLEKTLDSLTALTTDNVEGFKKIEDSKIEEKLFLPGEKAVLKNNLKKGSSIGVKDLENPKNFPKLLDSNLINLESSTLTREEVLGKKVNKDIPALTSLDQSMLEGYEGKSIDKNKWQRNESLGILKINIEEGKGINIEVPLGSAILGEIQDLNKLEVGNLFKEEINDSSFLEEKIVRTLKKRYFNIEKVEFGPETKIKGTTLYIRKNIEEDAKNIDKLVKNVSVELITPDKYNTYSETIMDVQPIATKEEGFELGSGNTRVLNGVIMMVTGTDENGVQIGEFGSSEGILEENIMWGRPGAPDKGEIFIKTNVTIAAGTNMERPGPLAAHKATDYITQEIRQVLKELDESLIVKEEEFVQKRRPGRKKVVIVKEIMGQGAMHDNLILPMEPVGILGAKPNVDLGNVPVVCSPLEILDGALHALTCIGPASKECSRHYWREPLVIEALQDKEVDLCGIILVGSPQINSEKFYVSKRVGMTVESMDVDGAFVTTEGFGNNHIDFASHIEEIGVREIPVVGMSFCAVQGALVVGNKYMKHMVDHNKSEAGIENEVLSCNTLTKEDAIRALAMLKAAMNGEEVLKAERKWSTDIKENNIRLIEEKTGMEIQRVDNEKSIPKSDKRKRKYG